MIDYKNQFDYIIYGATIPGVVLAIKKAQENKSVLLINHYGFLGGNITESLSCLQIIDPLCLGEITAQIFNALKTKQNGLPAVGDNAFLLDPEAVKITLQEFMEQVPVHVLYHVRAIKISAETETGLVVSLSAKEGVLNITGKTVVDTTDEQHLQMLLRGKNIEQQKYRLNVIIRSEHLSFLQTFKPKALIRLGINRYWMSVVLPVSGENDAAESMQQYLTVISRALVDRNDRLQVVPVHADMIGYPRIEEHKMNESLLFLPEMLTGSFTEEEAFAKASRLEGLT